MEIDYGRLSARLEELEEERKIPRIRVPDPMRGLTGELARKMSAGLAGHRSGVMTCAEEKEVERIQAKFDRDFPDKGYYMAVDWKAIKGKKK